MTNRKAARRYTTAMYLTAEELKQVDAVKKDFEDIKKSLDASRELKLFVESPIINPDKKSEVIKALFTGRIDSLTLKLLEMLCQKNRINLLRDIAVNMLDVINEKRGIVKANITTAVEIQADEKKAITEKLKKYSGREISAEYSIDKSIKGGFIAQIEDRIIDASITRQLELLREKFKSGSFNN
jgi:F-type H+-transporting ATPase subunit delta